MIKRILPKFSGVFYLSFLCFLAFTLITLSACDLAKNQIKPDRGANLEMQDFRDGLAPRLPEVNKDASYNSSSIPALQPYMAQGTQNMKSMPLVSLSVNQTIPLRDVLFELAKQADYDLELDPLIRGSIIFTARNRPFDQVIERISNAAGLRYSFNDDVLRVELDTPYNKAYKIDYLSYIRTNKGSVRNDIAVVSGDGADTGSSFEAISESEADFWGELDNALTQLLDAERGSLKTKKDPRIIATEQNPDVQAVAPVSEDGSVLVQAPQAVLRVESLPVDGEDSGSSNSKEEKIKQGFSINKHAGLISVYASERSHKEVAEYLEIVRRSSTAQVLIEAKILEVSLNDEYVTGIDWASTGLFSGELITNFFNDGSLLGTITPDIFPIPTGTVISGNTNFAVGYNGNDIHALIEAISGFGSVRALASPRMTVLNNQSAVLNVATNQVYLRLILIAQQMTVLLRSMLIVIFAMFRLAFS